MSSALLSVERSGIRIPVGKFDLAADLALPRDPVGLVIFAHGSGSSRHSPRNRFVADVLNRGGIATILADLLTETEETVDRHSGRLRFDIGLLSRRLSAITEWAGGQPRLSELRVGYFGASTGAAAALRAAGEQTRVVRAIVSRGGRPDLTGPPLRWVMAPTLFLVGENDPVVLDLNRQAMAELPPQTERCLEIVADATHLFVEPGALDQVAELAGSWFQKHLRINSKERRSL
jgi:dienelactone hydrolase